MRRHQRGQAITETAIVVPLFVTLFIGVFVAGAFVSVRVSAVNSARQGARMASLMGGQNQTLSQTEVDTRITDAVLTSAKLPNSQISEIDIYCQSGAACGSATPTADGSFDAANDLYDRFTVAVNSSGVNVATPVNSQQTFTLAKRTQVPPDEVSIGVRIVYKYTSPIAGLFAEYTHDLTDYAVMKATSVLV